MIASKIKRGRVEFAILAVLSAERLYGYKIAQRIEQRTCEAATAKTQGSPRGCRSKLATNSREKF